MVNKGLIALGGLAIVGLAAYLIFGTKGAGTSGSQANPSTSVQTPVYTIPQSTFSSTPGLTTGGSGQGNFSLQQTYSPYYSTSNTLVKNTTATTTNNSSTSVKAGLWGIFGSG